MAFVTISGFPSSGKSRLAAALKADWERRIVEAASNLSVVVLEDDIGPEGRAIYQESAKEKPVRASLLSTVVRSLNKNTIVICDAMNYIKGYRYQMHQAAKEANVRFCTIHVAAPPEKCREWNSSRNPSEAYPDSVMDALLMRFEEPSSMARWDSPLFTVAWDDPSPPFDDLWTALTTGAKAKANASVIPNGQTAVSTVQSLHTMTSTVVTLLMEHLSYSPLSPRLPLPSPPYPPGGLALPHRTITLSEMSRLKRQFETIQTQGFKRGGVGVQRSNWGDKEWAEAFVRFLEGQWFGLIEI